MSVFRSRTTGLGFQEFQDLAQKKFSAFKE
jgi:hypothetical protein